MIANPRRGQVAVDVGGRERSLRFDLNALVAAQHSLKVRGLNDMLDAIRRVDAVAIRTLLHIGLGHQDADLTAAQVGAWELALDPISARLVEALLLAWRGPEGNAGGPAADGPGTSTSPSSSPTDPSD